MKPLQEMHGEVRSTFITTNFPSRLIRPHLPFRATRASPPLNGPAIPGTIENIAWTDDDFEVERWTPAELDLTGRLHLDYGYAVTSHSRQGRTADRVPVRVDAEMAAKDLLNSRMAYVAVLRGAHDAQVFTNDVAALG